jgi:hypothetical protein
MNRDTLIFTGALVATLAVEGVCRWMDAVDPPVAPPHAGLRLAVLGDPGVDPIVLGGQLGLILGVPTTIVAATALPELEGMLPGVDLAVVVLHGEEAPSARFFTGPGDWGSVFRPDLLPLDDHAALAAAPLAPLEALLARAAATKVPLAFVSGPSYSVPPAVVLRLRAAGAPLIDLQRARPKTDLYTARLAAALAAMFPDARREVSSDTPVHQAGSRGRRAAE